MKTEDAGNYGGTCDTCSDGVAKPGHLCCSTCERWQDEEEAHIDEQSKTPDHEKRQALVQYYADIAATARNTIEDADLMGRTVQYLESDGLDLEYRRVRQS